MFLIDSFTTLGVFISQRTHKAMVLIIWSREGIIFTFNLYHITLCSLKKNLNLSFYKMYLADKRYVKCAESLL